MPEKFRRGIVFCCIIFGYRKSLGRSGEEYPEFLSTLFCHTVPKNYLGESFSVALNSSSEKVWIGGRGEYQYFPLKNICITLPKISIGESFTVALISGSKKVYRQEEGGEYQDLSAKISCLEVPKDSVRNLLLLH